MNGPWYGVWIKLKNEQKSLQLELKTNPPIERIRAIRLRLKLIIFEITDAYKKMMGSK